MTLAADISCNYDKDFLNNPLITVAQKTSYQSIFDLCVANLSEVCHQSMGPNAEVHAIVDARNDPTKVSTYTCSCKTGFVFSLGKCIVQTDLTNQCYSYSSPTEVDTTKHSTCGCLPGYHQSSGMCVNNLNDQYCHLTSFGTKSLDHMTFTPKGCFCESGYHYSVDKCVSVQEDALTQERKAEADKQATIQAEVQRQAKAELQKKMDAQCVSDHGENYAYSSTGRTCECASGYSLYGKACLNPDKDTKCKLWHGEHSIDTSTWGTSPICDCEKGYSLNQQQQCATTSIITPVGTTTQISVPIPAQKITRPLTTPTKKALEQPTIKTTIITVATTSLENHNVQKIK